MGLFDNALSGFGLQRFKEQPPAANATDAPVVKASDLSSGPGAWFDIFGNNNGTNFTTFNNMKQQMLSYTDWVYAAVHTISEQCAAIDLRVFINRSSNSKAAIGRRMFTDKSGTNKLMRQTTSGLVLQKGKLVQKDNLPLLEEVQDHPLLDLLNAPNPFMTGNEFFEMTFLHLELTGNAFWAVERDNKKKPQALWPLMPQFIKIIADKEKFITGYTYTVNNEEIPFEPDDIIHHKYSNPNDLRMGTSTVQAAARAIDTDSHAADYNRKFFYNSAQPDAVLYTDSEVDDKMYKRLVSQWRDSYGGTANSHRTAILENGLKYQPRVLTQKDMDFLSGRNFNRDMILSIFGVPKSIIGLDESMSRANAETAEYVFVKGKIRPKMLRLCARITEDLAPQYDEKLVVSFTDPVPSDKEFMLKSRESSVNTWKTVNEIRAEDGDDPIDGGDKLYISNTMHELGVEPVVQPAPSTDPNNETNPTDPAKPANPENAPKPATDSNDGGSTGKGLAIVGNGDPEQLVQPAAKKKDSKAKRAASISTRALVQKGFAETRNDLSEKFELRFLRAARQVFLEQKKEVLENFKNRFSKRYKPSQRKATQQEKSDLDGLFDAAVSLAAWRTVYESIYGSAVEEMGIEAMRYAVDVAAELDLIPTATTYDATTTGVTRFYEQRITKIGSSIDAETDKQLKASLSEGISKGETISQLATRIENIYGAAAGYRAERIARTESILSTTWATRDAWRRSGVVSGQKWITGGNPCSFCASMDGKTLGISSAAVYFNLGDTMTLDDGSTMTFSYDAVSGPPLHVNCRCDLIPVMMGETV